MEKLKIYWQKNRSIAKNLQSLISEDSVARHNPTMRSEQLGRRIAIGILLSIVAIIGFITLPALPYAGDPYAWREEARSIILNGTLHVPSEIATNYGARGQYYVQNTYNGLWYSKYGIVSSILNVVPLVVEKSISGELPYGDPPIRIFILGIFFLILALIIAYLMFEISGFYISNIFARTIFVLLVLYSTYEWNYLRTTSAESTLLLFTLLFYYFFLRFIRQKGSISKHPLLFVYFAWFAILILTETRFYFFAFAGTFGLFLIYLAFKEKSFDKKEVVNRLREIFPFIIRAVIIPGAICAIMFGLISWVKFGSPLFTGYQGWIDPTSRNSFLTKLYDFTINPQWSLIICFPPLLLALFGVKRFFQKNRLEASFIAIVFILFIFIIGSMPFYRGEASYGMRYFVFVLPLLALPALYPLEWVCTIASSKYRYMKILLLVIIISLGISLAIVQLQVHRLDFFFKYWVEQDIRNLGVKNNKVYEYFSSVNFAEINWDHISAVGQWQKLPYFQYLCKELKPEEILLLEQKIQDRVYQSNLFWFPNINKFESKNSIPSPIKCDYQ